MLKLSRHLFKFVAESEERGDEEEEAGQTKRQEGKKLQHPVDERPLLSRVKTDHQTD